MQDSLGGRMGAIELFRARRSLRLSRSAMAVRLGVPVASLEAWERGTEDPPAEVLERAAGCRQRRLRPTTIDPATLSDRIKQYRKQANLTDWQLAASVGVAPQHVYLWQRGMVPRPGRLEQIAEALGVSVPDLTG